MQIATVSSTVALVHPAKISHSIGLSSTGSLDLLREALSLLILYLTLGRTTNNSFFFFFPLGVQGSIIHTDLPWLQFRLIFSHAWRGQTLPHIVDAESTATIFPAGIHLITVFIFDKWRERIDLRCCDSNYPAYLLNCNGHIKDVKYSI